MERTHTCNDLRIKDDKKEVTLIGWAQRIRDHGGKKFIDLRDREGLTQIVFDPDVTSNFSDVEDFKREYLIKVIGKVRPRPEGTINKKLGSGEVEVLVNSFEVISKSETLPFEIDSENLSEVNEEIRMQYRYLDLRRPEMYKTLRNRHKFLKAARDILDSKGFLEVETPNLTKATPEGSRDFLVPYRKKKGEFFALPQSPQMFKQILMVAGVERYFQVATCFRDEDLRKDRQYEHKQLDMELSFVSQEELFEITEKVFKEAFKSVYNIDLDSFETIEYRESMDRFGCDKPDLRIKMDELVDVSQIVKDSGFSVFANNVKSGGLVKGLKLTNGQELLTRKDIDKLIEVSQRDWGAKGLAWMKVMKNEIEGSICKFFKEDELTELRSSFKAENGDLLFFVSDSYKKTNSILDSLRRHLADRFDLMDKDKHLFTFVTNFPLFDWNEEDDSLTFEHSPFTMPLEEDRDFLMKLSFDKIKDNKEELLKMGSTSYDLVYNGLEVGSGALRVYIPDLQVQILKLLGMDEERIEENFGWLIKAYSYGAPYHRGWGLGIDRILMLAENKGSIRDVIAFPRNKHGFCPLTNSPSSVDSNLLKELGLKLDIKEDKKKE